MTEPTLILHIGAPKSASTALQGFLRRKARSLLRKGVAAAGNKLYFNFEDEFVGHGGTIKFFSDILRNQENKTVVTERILEAANRASKRDIRLLVISCEFLMGTQHKTAAQKVEIFRDAARELPVRIVAYLRPQYSYIPSAWTQWFDHRRIIPLDKFIDHCLRSGTPSYSRLLAPWTDLVGKAGMYVRTLSRDVLFDSFVITDFQRVLQTNIACRDIPIECCNPRRFARMRYAARALAK